MERIINKYSIQIDQNQNQNADYGKFVFQPLEEGFGTTLGNSLRRVLLSSISGNSLFAIKIPNVTHEFQALKGVQEDVTQIILNLKKIAIKIDQEIFGLKAQNQTPLEKWPTLKIDVKEAGVVTGKDIKTPIGFEIVNKDAYIATVEDKGKLKMELYAKTGKGFVSFKDNKEFVNAINLIAVDSNFSPIVKVGYKVDPIKTTKRELNDVLELEVATNGTISAAEAVAVSAKILDDHYQIVVDQLVYNYKDLKVISNDDSANIVKKTLSSSSIDELELTVRSYNCLKRAGIHTIMELTDKTAVELSRIRNLGKKSYKEILQRLNERGLKLKNET